MPIYEFFCKDCNTVFSFFSRYTDREKIPPCPLCRKNLERRMSIFSVPGNTDKTDSVIDEEKMERAINLLAKEGPSIDENDPRQSAGLLKKISGVAGVSLGKNMKEALDRMESGEDPVKIEKDMEGLLDRDPFILKTQNNQTEKSTGKSCGPKIDDRLHEI